MQGCGSLTDQVELCDNRIKCFKDGKWQTAKEPLHNYCCNKYPDGGAGLAMSLGLRLLDDYPDWEIGFIPCAVSGSRLEQWEPGAELFEKALADTKKALCCMEGEIVSILWHQGEADAKTAERANSYSRRFRRTIEVFRKELNCADLPIIAGELGHFLKNNNDCKYYEVVNEALKNNADEFVSASGLTDNDRKDNTHFDTLSLRKFGARYSEKFLKIMKNK